MELGVEEAEEAVPEVGGGYEEEEKEGGKKTVAEVAVEGTAVPFEEDGDGEGDGVGRAEPPPPTAPPETDEALGVEVNTPPPLPAEGRIIIELLGVELVPTPIGFSCKICASHSSLRRSISETLERKNE